MKDTAKSNACGAAEKREISILKVAAKGAESLSDETVKTLMELISPYENEDDGK